MRYEAGDRVILHNSARAESGPHAEEAEWAPRVATVIAADVHPENPEFVLGYRVEEDGEVITVGKGAIARLARASELCPATEALIAGLD